jgi:hypothetical protein
MTTKRNLIWYPRTCGLGCNGLYCMTKAYILQIHTNTNTRVCTPTARPLRTACGRSHSPLAYSMYMLFRQKKNTSIDPIVRCVYDTAYYLYDPV